MKKFSILFVALFAFVAFAALPNATACGEKSTADNSKVEAKQASAKGSCAAKTDATQASAKDGCASKATAQAVNSKSGCASKTDATQADAKSGCAAKTDAIQASAHGCEGYAGNCEKVAMKVTGMTCGGCEKSVEACLMKIDGVLKVEKVDHASGTAMVCIDPSKVKSDALTTAVSAKGYGAEIMPAVAKTDATGEAAGCSASKGASTVSAEKGSCAAKKAADKSDKSDKSTGAM
jgi:copper chaperone CopZ